ncbi:cupin domain-containing protein [Ralstonia sp. CHL-2022]|uniref:Cupin domain-containing protein n=1 Tax=Ralstonia mojiangensis TaxID=2953895 RepID=A0AAE3LB60_9RALS|nr:cupin domain-containing protein [Ralstonia mojiangensis]MCT7296650.1 cupin domain-containing protein [Ralstonia mojiangensis]MCT7311064.1 cupin domain-containing protein [Ralstonia mojiangensis]MCT7315197.1 cupin domain-containing protein [Ralstonia mojiangensis]
MHRHRSVAAVRAVCAVAGFAALVGHASTFAQASAPAAPPAAQPVPPLSAQIINMGGMTPDEIGPVIAEMGTLRTKTLVTAANGTVGIQVGTVAKHTHTYSDEIQYVMSGTATVWLDNGSREVRAGDLIVIPRGVVHGTLTTSTDFKAMAIKLPPQRAGDTHKVP